MLEKLKETDSAILQWMDKNKILNSRGDRFEWLEHGFLLRPLADWNRRIYIRKSAQIGFSESFGIMKALFAAAYYKLNVIYTLPTDRGAETFASTKLTPILNYNPELSSIAKGSLMTKSIKNRFVYFRGTHSTKGRGHEAETDRGISITSDLNIHDEADRSDPKTMEQYESRLENSDYGGKWLFSNPTYPGMGTDHGFEQSRQYHWFIKCGHCGHRQYMDWVKAGTAKTTDSCLVDPEKKIYTCAKCGKKIERADILNGEWVAKYPDRLDSGYWIGQMMYVKHSVESLLEKEKKNTQQHFFNFVIGKPYIEAERNIDRNLVARNIVMHDNSRKDVAMGVDQGVWKHFVIGNKEGIFEIGKTKNWSVIEAKIKKYNAITVIDAGPSMSIVDRIIKKNRGRVFKCFYVKDRDAMADVLWMRKGDRGVVKVQRNRYFDKLTEKMAQGEKPINIAWRDLAEYMEHWESMMRKNVEDSKGMIRPEWVSINKVDHYCHATLYQDVAMEKLNKRLEWTPPQKPTEKKTEVSDIIDKLLKGSRGVDWRYC